jgi:nucleotide-binding universal stress UspA family protein
VRRAGLLARRTDAELTLLHVVDDDQPPRLVEIESREAENYLQELTASIPELQGLRCETMVVPGDAFDGILRVAKSRSADLVVMGAHRRQMLRDIFVGTTIERVIRMGSFPVLMVNTEPDRTYGKVMAAIDLSESSAHAITTAKALELTGDAMLTLVHGFDAVAEGKLSFAGVGEEEIGNYVADGQFRAGQEIVAFLEANDLGQDAWSLRVKKGLALDVISDAVQEVSPDLLVMGTHGRSGMLKFLLGSVAEDVLRSIEVDVLVVPPIGR